MKILGRVITICLSYLLFLVSPTFSYAQPQDFIITIISDGSFSINSVYLWTDQQFRIANQSNQTAALAAIWSNDGETLLGNLAPGQTTGPINLRNNIDATIFRTDRPSFNVKVFHGPPPAGGGVRVQTIANTNVVNSTSQATTQLPATGGNGFIPLILILGGLALLRFKRTF